MIVDPDHELPGSPCPYCKKYLDLATQVGGVGGPAPGDFTVCIDCANPLVFCDDLSLRVLMGDEKKEIESDDRYVAIQNAIAERKKTQ